MTCRRCAQPIERCHYQALHPSTWCRGWRHSATSWHHCTGPQTGCAEPEPGQPPLTETPETAPAGEVA